MNFSWSVSRAVCEPRRPRFAANEVPDLSVRRQRVAVASGSAKGAHDAVPSGMPRLRCIATAVTLAACAAHSPGSIPMSSDPAEKLRSIGDRYWNALLATTTLTALNQNGVGYLGGPIYATSVGDHRFDEKLDDLSPAALAALVATMRGLRDELDRVPPNDLQGEDALSYEILRRSRAGFRKRQATSRRLPTTCDAASGKV